MLLSPPHGHSGCPKVWPWWLLFTLRIVRASVRPPSLGYIFYCYTRPNVCRFIEVFFDRRSSEDSPR